MSYPRRVPPLPDRFCGMPKIADGLCAGDCRACEEACPVDAVIRPPDGAVRIDMGRCLFCRACEKACPRGAIRFTAGHALAAARREDLIVGSGEAKLAAELDKRTRRLFGRSLKLRQVSAGGCNACEADTNVLNTLAWDLGRFGIQFVASPRHADGLLVTGPLSTNMELALRKTWEAVPAPRIVIAVGSCAIAGGPYAGHQEVRGGAAGVVPVDLHIPGCPPHPLTILDGLLRMLGRLEAAVDDRWPPRRACPPDGEME